MKFAAVLLAVVAQGAAAQFPTQAPAPMPLTPTRFPPFQQVKLANGLNLLVVENHKNPVVSIRLAMPGGSRFDPAGKEGLAALVADLITKGTATRTADQIAAAIEGAGASLQGDAGDDVLNLESEVLTDYAPLAFELMGDVVRNSTYPASEVDLARTRALSAVRLEASQPASIAQRFFDGALYGSHPYGQHPTETSVGSLNQAAVKAFVAQRLRPGGSLLVVSGDITLARAQSLATKSFGGWTGNAAGVTRVPSPPAGKATTITLVNRPGSVQSDIVVGNLTTKPGDSTWYALTVLNKVLGGGTDSRLFQIIREQRNWTYDAHSSVSRPRDVGSFSAGTEVRTEVTDSALAETLKQLKRLRTEPVTEPEIRAAKGYLVGVFPLSIETPQQVAGQVASVTLLGLPSTYLSTYRQRVEAVTPAAVQRTARRLVRPDSAVIVVVGDGPALYDKLKAIAPVNIVDPDGKPLTPADLKPKAAALPWDLTQVTARHDSFSVIVQGQAYGAWTRIITAAGDSLTSVQDIEIPLGGASIRETMNLDRTGLRARKVDQTSTSQNGTSEIHLALAGDGHVTGTVSNVPQRGGGPRTGPVDTTLAPPAIVGSVLGTFIEALPLAAGATFAIASYNTGTGRVDNVSVKVTDGGSVTVPAGTFDVWKVDTEGGDAPSTYYVAKAPRRLVKRTITGVPFTFELAAK